MPVVTLVLDRFKQAGLVELEKSDIEPLVLRVGNGLEVNHPNS